MKAPKYLHRAILLLALSFTAGSRSAHAGNLADDNFTLANPTKVFYVPPLTPLL